MSTAARKAQMRANAAKVRGAFFVKRKNVGLTYSCPVGVSNPIPDKEAILSALTERFGPSKYVVSHELHESGQSHYHAYFKFDSKLEVTDPRAFDLHDVHPNILNAGPGWIHYCRKHGDYITNLDRRDAFREALRSGSVDEGLEIIKLLDPGAYCRFGQSIELNLRRHLSSWLVLTVKLQKPQNPPKQTKTSKTSKTKKI